MSIFRDLAAAALSAFFLVAAAHAAGPGTKQFFKPLPAAKATRAPDQITDPIAVQWNSDEMLKLRPGEEISLSLPGLTARDVVFERSVDHGGGIHSWLGYFKERGRDNAVIVTSGPAGSYGVIESPDGIYRIVPGDGTHDWLVDMAKQGKPVTGPIENDALIPPQTQPAAPAPSPEKATPMPLTDIDLMVVLTRTLADRLGPNLMTRMSFLITRANQTYAASEIGINLRLVKISVVDYPDSGSDGTALNAITPGSSTFASVFSNIEAERAAAGADLVSLMRYGSELGGSGIAWVGGFNGGAFNASVMYSVVTGCVSACESVFIHELGHNMGNLHDRYTDAYQNTTSAPQRTGAKPYGYGYAFCATGTMTCTPTIANGTPGTCTTGQPECSTGTSLQNNTNFRDIMAYFQASTQEVYKFSNPNITCQTANGDAVPRPCGVPQANPDSADTASSMNITRTSVAAMKPTVSASLMPGSLQFTQTGYGAAETAGSITFTVSRVRDSTISGGGGAVSVTYTTAGGTATSGVDFTATTGTLSWADGDFTNKSFSVPITADAVAEGAEFFTVSLSSPTGAAGVFLAYPTTAVGIINDVAWPPGGLMPAGFTTPGTSAGAWTTATDQAYEGTTSLRSAQVLAATQGTYVYSDMTYTGSILAGQGAFAYRVSSYQGYGFFEFLLDGTVLLDATGETGWRAYTFSISTTGIHTLTFRYKNRLNFRCNVANPPAEGGASCADRAWIDALSLPQPGTNISTTVLSSSTLSTTTASPVTLTAAVSGSVGAAAGTVTFNDGATTLGTSTLSGGVATLVVPSLSVGTHTITASYSGDPNYAASTSSAVSVGVAGATNPPRLGNISTRMQVLTGNNVMIAGFIVGGSTPKTLAITAQGPSLIPAGIPNALANPTLQLVRSSDGVTIATNDDWQSGPYAAQLTAASLAPPHPLESGIVVTLAPGAYTAIVSGVGGTGVGLVGVFEVDHPEVPLVNISTRGLVLTGGDIMIGGFIVNGSGPQTVVVHGIGPALAGAGIANALADPTISLVRAADGVVLATNDDWQSAPNASAIQAAGLAPSNAKESAIMMSLQPGAYTVLLSGVGGATGVGIVAVYTTP